ncbi:hypothetical protein D3C84_662240 [compost metagenome]
MPMTENTWAKATPLKRSRNKVCVTTEPTAAPNAARPWAANRASKVLTLSAINEAAAYRANPASIVGRRPIRSHIRPHTTTPNANARK